MNVFTHFTDESRETPFSSYQEYTEFLFACVNQQLSNYIEGLMRIFANDNGGFKNVLYPDIEIAHDLCQKKLSDFSAEAFPIGQSLLQCTIIAAMLTGII